MYNPKTPSNPTDLARIAELERALEVIQAENQAMKGFVSVWKERVRRAEAYAKNLERIIADLRHGRGDDEPDAWRRILRR